MKLTNNQIRVLHAAGVPIERLNLTAGYWFKEVNLAAAPVNCLHRVKPGYQLTREQLLAAQAAGVACQCKDVRWQDGQWEFNAPPELYRISDAYENGPNPREEEKTSAAPAPVAAAPDAMDEDTESALELMTTHGAVFVRRLADLYREAAPGNARILRGAFAKYFEEYERRARFDRMHQEGLE